MIKPLSDEWIPWFVDIFIDNRQELVDFLKKHKISTRPVYQEINKTKMYYSKKVLLNSNYICSKGLFLPSYITIKNEDILQICKLINFFLY